MACVSNEALTNAYSMYENSLEEAADCCLSLRYDLQGIYLSILVFIYLSIFLSMIRCRFRQERGAKSMGKSRNISAIAKQLLDIEAGGSGSGHDDSDDEDNDEEDDDTFVVCAACMVVVAMLVFWKQLCLPLRAIHSLLWCQGSCQRSCSRERLLVLPRLSCSAFPACSLLSL